MKRKIFEQKDGKRIVYDQQAYDKLMKILPDLAKGATSKDGMVVKLVTKDKLN